MKRSRRATILAWVALPLLALLPPRLGAQVAASSAEATGAAGAGRAAGARDTLRTPSLFVSRDAWIAGGFLLGTIAMAPLDGRIARALQEPSTQASRMTRSAADAFNVIGDPGALLAGVSLYGVGRVGHLPRVADLGLHSTEAIVLSGVITAAIKDVAGRARPYVDVGDPDNFTFGRGLGHGTFASFPSGHATAAFAAATVVTLETAEWWPRSRWYVAPAMYGGATLVGLARLYTNKHWASDVVMGAGIGTLTGLKVVRFHQTRPRNRLDRWLLGTATSAVIVPDGHGRTMVGWSIEAHD